MKKIISIIVSISILILQIPVLAISGSGTAANPYLISSASDIALIHNDLDGYYKLMSNINMSGVSFTPIGNENEGAFTGTIDGCGYSIQNLNINQPDNKYVGFIGFLEGTVKNLNVTNVNAFGYRYVGGVVGYAEEGSVVSNCSANGKASGEYQIINMNIGGVVGYNCGTVSECDNYANIQSSGYSCNYIGGVIGYNNQGEIRGCTNSGNISGESYSGGIIGYNYNGIVTGCKNGGIVNGSSSCKGGIIGYSMNGTVSDCKNGGNISSGTTGGIVGQGYTMINNCENGGTVNGSCAGGIIGNGYEYNFGYSRIKNSSNSGAISGGSDVGGIIGYSGTAYNCTNSGTIIGKKVYGISEGYAYNSINKGILDGEIAYGVSKDAYNCTNTGTFADACTQNIASTIHNITLSPAHVQLGLTGTMPIELYEYDRELIWTSDDTTIATVNSKGLITGVRVGSTTIHAKTELGIETSATITVIPQLATNITLNKTRVEMDAGDTVQLAANLTPSNSTDTISWSSSDTSVVTVSNGLVRGIGSGTATVTASTSSGRNAACVVTVTARNEIVEVTSVSIQQSEITLAIDEAKALNVLVTPSNATDTRLIYTSSDENVAIINQQGVITAKSTGVAIVKAQSLNGYYDECVVRVVSAEEASVVLSAEKAVPGSTVSVKASIVKNPGISAYKFIVNYDSEVLTPIKITQNPEFDGDFTTNLEDINRNELQILWYNTENVPNSSDLFTVEFTVADNAKTDTVTDVELSYSANDICNVSGDRFAIYTEPVRITVEGPLPGDIYADGDINTYDLTLLARYVTGLEKFTAYQLNVADVNDDGEVDIKDVVKMAQYLVGWSGVELMSLSEGTVDIDIASVTADENGEAEIPVSIANNTGIAGFRYNINYNSDELEILDIVPNTELLTENLQTNLGQEADNGLLVTWYQEDNMTDNGTLFTIKAKLKNGVKTSDISINQADNNMCNQSLSNVIGVYSAGNVRKEFAPDEPHTITEPNMADGQYVLSTELFNVDSGKKVIVAAYDADNTLVEVKTTVNDNNTVETKFNENADIAYFNIMVWDSLDGMKPVTVTERVNK